MDWDKAQALAVKTEHGLELRELGKLAAARFLEDGMPLGEAVGSIVKKSALNAEQTKRVCEFANNAVLMAKLAAGERKIDFVVADPDAVLRDTPSAPTAPIAMKVAAPQLIPLSGSAFERRAVLMSTDELVEGICGAPLRGPEKVASAQPGKLPATAVAARRALQETEGKVDGWEDVRKEAEARLARELRNLLLDGEPYTPLSKLCSAHGLMGPLEAAVRMLPAYKTVKLGPDEAEHAPDHPIMAKFAACADAAERAGKARAARNILRQLVAEVDGAVAQQFSRGAR